MGTVRGFAWLVVFVALAAPAAGATPQILARGTTAPVGSPVVRTAANGDLMVLWSDGTRVRAAFRLNGGPFFAGHVVPGLPSLGSASARVQPLLTTSGDAVVVWPGSGSTRRLVAHAPRGGPFDAPQSAPAPLGFGALAFSPDGHGAVLSGPSPGLSVALGEPDGRWGAPQRLATGLVLSPRVAVGDDGGVVVVWTARGPCGPRLPHTVVAQCEFARAAVRPPGGVLGPPITFEASQARVGAPQAMVDAAGRPVVLWRRSFGEVNATTMIARGSFTGGFAAPVALPSTDRPAPGACPLHPGLTTAPDPYVVAVRPRPDGGAFVLIDRDEGCGPLLSEVPLGPDGTVGTPLPLTAAPLAPKLGMDLIGLGGRTPALVTRTAAGAVAVARTAPDAPFAAPIAVELPARARRGPTTVLRDGRVVVAFSRPCRPGAHVAEAVVVAPDGSASKRRRLSRCGDPSPAMIDRNGRAVFVARRNGALVAWATAPVG